VRRASTRAKSGRRPAQSQFARQVVIADDGEHVLAMDDWHKVGYGDHVLAFYDRKGLVKKYSLEQMLGVSDPKTCGS
jgi:hypothetical protein